jgi:flagellar hook-length control protein FliK
VISSQLAPTEAQGVAEQTALGSQTPTQKKAAIKNNKLGVFAKILDGLISNGKQSAAGAAMQTPAQPTIAAKSARLTTATQKTAAHIAEDAETEPAVKNKVGKTSVQAAKKTGAAGPVQETADAVAIAEKAVGAHMAKMSDTIETTSDTDTVITEEASEAFWDNVAIVQAAGADADIQGADTAAQKAPGAFSSRAESTNMIPHDLFPQEAMVFEDALVKDVQPDRNTAVLANAANGMSREKNVKEALLRQNASSEKLNVQNLFAGTMKNKEEPENTAKPAEARGKGRLELRDLRVRDVASGVVHTVFVGTEKVAVVSESGAQNIAEISLDLLPDGSKPFDTPIDTSEARAANFENLLARELSQHLNSDIVQQAQVLLRDGDAGTIKLSLRPESLGIVKVHLEMVENKITGQIIVESNEALRAFDREIQSLEQAFRDSGFSGVSLYTALASDSGQNSEENWQQQEQAAFFSKRLAVGQYEPEVHLVSGGKTHELSTVNMLA